MRANDLDHRTADAGLRDKNRQLEGKMGELLQFGEENDAISEKMHRLAVGMIAARSFQSVLHTLNFHLRDDFAVPHVAVRLWHHPEGSDELPEFAEVSQELQAFAETLAQPYCGSTSGFETSSGSARRRLHVRSQALIAMRNGGGTIGMIALGSEDLERFYAGDGNDLPRASRRNGVGGAGARPVAESGR
jgi:uncharacterized protein YigA (DUF484 family)